MPNELVPTRFDPTQLQPAEREFLRSAETRIRGSVVRMASELIVIGATLCAVKERLGHGHFMLWASSELPWSHAMTNKFCNVAKFFGDRDVTKFQPSALYVLSWPGVPEQAREYACELAEDGQEITHAEAKEIIDSYRPAGGAANRPTPPKPQREHQARPDEAKDARAADSWRRLIRLSRENHFISFSRNEDDDGDNAEWQATTYPDSGNSSIKSFAAKSIESVVARAAGEETLKTCTRCGVPLPLDRFQALTSSSDGLAPRCAACDRLRRGKRTRK